MCSLLAKFAKDQAQGGNRTPSLGLQGRSHGVGAFSRVRLTKLFPFKKKWNQKCGTRREEAKYIFIGGRKEKKKSQASMTPVFLPSSHSLQLFK